MTNAMRPGGDRAASVALILASLFLAGCTADPQEESGTGPGGHETAHSTYEHAGADNVVVLVTDRALEDGAETLGFDVSTTATFVLLGNGTAIVPGELDSEPVGGTYPPYPEILPTRSLTVHDDKIQRLLGLADNLGLLGGDIDYGHLGEPALPYTDVSITVGGATYTQSADGLGYDYPTTTLSDAQIDARAELFALSTGPRRWPRRPASPTFPARYSPSVMACCQGRAWIPSRGSRGFGPT